MNKLNKAQQVIKALHEEEDYMSMDDPGSAIKKDFKVDSHGIISNPGKFEGEMYYTPYYYDVGMNGMADEDSGSAWLFELGEEDYKKFPELKGHKNIIISSNDQGFVYGEVDGELPEPEEGDDFEREGEDD